MNRKPANATTDSRSLRKRLVFYSLGLTLLVVLSFAWLSWQNLRTSFAERQLDYHTSIFRIANEYLNDYLYGLDGKLSVLTRQPLITDFLEKPPAGNDFPAINTRLATIGFLLNKQFWPQNKVDELVLIGPAGLALSFRYSAEKRYLGEDFRLSSRVSQASVLMDLAPGDTALVYNLRTAGLDLDENMADRLLFAKRLVAADGQAGGLVIAILSNSFLPTLFDGLADDSTLAVSDLGGHPIWTNAAGPVGAGEAVNSTHSLGPQSLVLRIQSDLGRAYPGLSFPDPIVVLTALACLLAVALAAPFLARRTVQPLQELSRRLSGFAAAPEPGQEMLDQTVPLAVPGSGILTRLFLYFGLTVGLPLAAFLALVSWNSWQVSYQGVARYVGATIRQAETYINYSFDFYNELTSQFIYSDQFQEAWPQSALSSEASGRYFADAFADLKRSKGEFFALNLYDVEGRPLYASPEMAGVSLATLLGPRAGELSESIGQLVLVGAVGNHYKKNLLAFARKVRGLRFTERPDIGYALFFVDPYQLSQVYGILGTNLSKYLFVVDSRDAVLAGYGTLSALDWSALAGRDRVRLGDDSRMVVDSPAVNWSYRMVGLIPSGEIRLMILPLLLTGIYVILFYVVLILLVSALFTSGIMRPIRRLAAALDQAGTADPPPANLAPWRSGGRSELAMIANRFNELVLDNYRSRLREQELAVLEREAQLNALQQQINPHFMYNTLEAIKWMAYRRQALDISDMASAMGNFLRGNMALGDNFTSLADEIEHLKSYIYIQQIRYADRFEVRWEIDENLLQSRVVRLILQPLVENAINHGFEEIRHKGLLVIRARRHGDGLLLEIADNGCGMDTDTLEKVRSRLDSRQPGQQGSIGLANVSQRLKLCFGRAAGLSIDSSSGQGTTITITLP